MTTEAALALSPRVIGRERAAAVVATAIPFCLGGLVTGVVASDAGGYLPTAWGWAALVLGWVAAIGLVLRFGHIAGLEASFAVGIAAFAGWTALSFLWTDSRTQTALAVERDLVYVLAAVAVVGAVRSGGYRGLVWGVWAGSTAVCFDALATRLLPDRLGVANPVAANRLTFPVGYWNGLGLLAAMAAVLALGLAVYGQPLVARLAAATTLPGLLATLYLTFSRGAWVALAAALVAALAMSPRKVGLLVAALSQTGPAALAVWLVDRTNVMHQTNPPIGAATHAGHTLLWQLPLAGVVAAVFAIAYSVGSRKRFPAAARHVFVSLMAVIAALGLLALLVHYGGPTEVVSRARHSIEGGTPGGANLNTRLFSLSSNERLHQWHVLIDEWRVNKLLGSGAGTWAEYWGVADPNQSQLVNPHNLYLAALAELGPVGLAILVAALAVPLVAAVRARRRSLVPIAAAAYVAFLVHVFYDWDWQLPGVALAALFCASGVLAAERSVARSSVRLTGRYALMALVVCAGTVSLLALLGNRALARSGNDLAAGRFSAAVAAAKDARRWAPWSSQPWEQLGRIRIATGDRAAARAAYRRAVAKDPRNWQLWLELASTSTGVERKRALAQLELLHPGSGSG
jgi:hypothetical protein